jgi:hypothetical protein
MVTCINHKHASAYQWNAENVFGKDDIITITVQNSESVSQTTLTRLQGEQTVFSLFEYPNSYLNYNFSFRI